MDLERSILGIGTLILLVWHGSLKGNLAISVGGAFLDMIFCMSTPLMSVVIKSLPEWENGKVFII